MALKQPTPVSFFRVLQLCWYAIFRPAKFDELEREDLEFINTAPNLEFGRRIDPVRRAFFGSLFAVLSAGVTGGLLGYAGRRLLGPSGMIVAVSAILGATILLWASLATKGWDIQTFSNATLTERVNRWLFRALYWIGTAALVTAASWAIDPYA